MHTRFVVILSILCSWAGSAYAQEVRVTSVDPIGIYSNMHFFDETGDVAGMEVHIVPVGDGYYAVVQFAEGGPEVPFVVSLLVNQNKVEFDILRNNRRVDKFVGVITSQGLTGKLESGNSDPATGKKTFFLRKGKSYWQR